MAENEINKSQGEKKEPAIHDLRLGLEEANRWIRHIDNFYWAISSFWVGGNAIALYNNYKLSEDSLMILFISTIMLFIWFLFFAFTRNTFSKMKYLSGVINKYEELLYIDIVPKFGSFSKTGIEFIPLMKILFYLFFITWGIIFALNVCEGSCAIINLISK